MDKNKETVAVIGGVAAALGLIWLLTRQASADDGNGNGGNGGNGNGGGGDVVFSLQAGENEITWPGQTMSVAEATAGLSGSVVVKERSHWWSPTSTKRVVSTLYAVGEDGGDNPNSLYFITVSMPQQWIIPEEWLI